MNALLKGLIKLLLAAIAFGLVGIVSVVGLVSYVSLDLPEIRSIADYHPDLPSQILSKDGRVLLEIGKEKRYVVPFEQIPPLIVNSVLAAEDDNFFNHKGIEYSGMLRALIQNIKAGRVAQGGSTITQQVAKSLLGDRSRSIVRKIKDVVLAQKMEERLTKKDILYLYLNQVYLGGGYYGVKAAFKGYFDKELSQVTPAESAIIAGLLVAPGKYSPYLNPIFAKKRQLYVLGRMLETKILTKEQYEKALNEKLKFRMKGPPPLGAGHFTDWIRQKLMEQVGEDNFLTQGYKVTTSLDWEMQKVAEEEVVRGVKELDKRQGYVGPLSTLSSDESIFQFEDDQRKEILYENSNFFYLFPDGQKQLEYPLLEDETKKIVSLRNDDALNKEGLLAGLTVKDSLNEVLQENEERQAVVVSVNDKKKIIFVSLGGTVGFIPVEEFQWAYPRKISEDTTYATAITTPSKIVKKGDVILVKVVKKAVSIWPHISGSFKGQNLDAALADKIKAQKYLMCSLEQIPVVQGALFSLNPKSGKILAFVGGNDFSKSQFNRVVQSQRQPGSSFKPFIFAAALENGFTPSDIIMDSPEALGGYDDSLSWKPKNYDGEFRGPVTLRTVVEESRNVPTVKVAEKLGIKVISDFLKRIRFNATIPPDLSISLGSFGVSLFDLVSSYAIFPNGGKRISPKYIISITDRYGKNVVFEESNESDKAGTIVDQAKAEIDATAAPTETEPEENVRKNEFLQSVSGDQVYDPRLAYVMTNLMKGVVQNGTAKAAKAIGANIAGKTGTTSNYVDAWFLGFSSNVVTGVWTGLDENKTLGWSETGARSALPIWMGYMKAALAKYGDTDFPVPAGIKFMLVNKTTGRPTKNTDPLAVMESFVDGTEPGSTKLDFSRDNGDASKRIMEEDDYFSNQ